MRVAQCWLVVACLLAGATAAQAQRTLAIERFHADVRVNADGTLDVTETIRARFTGSWNGIYRTIPVAYRTPQGFNYTLRLDIVSMADDGGRALKYEASNDRHYRKVKIWVPGAADTTKTVVVRYRVRNGLKFFEEHDELYWNVTGDEWEVPIAAATATIHLPAGVTGLRTAAFTGGYGSQESAARITVTGADITVESSRALNFREGLTAAIAWDPGVVARPTAAGKAADFLRANGILLLPVAVFGLMWRLWSRRGRDPRRRPVAVQYEPPAKLTPAEVGTLVDNQPDLRDITATIVDLAVRGFLRIRETQEDRFFGLSKNTEYSLELTKPKDAWSGLLPHEDALLEALFLRTSRAADGAEAPGAPVDTVRISDLKNRFYKSLPGIRDRIFDRLVAEGYYVKRPDKVRGTFIGVSAIVMVVGVLAGGIFEFGLAYIVAVIVSAVIVGAFGAVMPARTEAGTRALEGALGFEEFLDRVESDRFARVVRTPEMFERFLPFAMAFGVESHWARAFEGIYTAQPHWYVGTHQGAFGPRMFAGSLASLSSDASSAMSSAPRSSGGSGFSGGSSGGGFGGGGGGGF
jgi:hypothetical protein